MNKLTDRVHEFVLEGFNHKFGTPEVRGEKDPIWREVRNSGTRLWLDTGDLDEAATLWNAEFEALTTNNTLLNREIQKGIYDDLVGKAAAAIKETAPDIDEKLLVLEVAFVLNAYHGLRLVEKFDAFVSVELHTDMANDVERTVEYGKRFYAVCPERFYIKVPLSAAGFVAARKLGKLGVPLNYTLGFSARQNYVAALFSQPRYVNVFMGRLNAFVADSNLGSGDNVGEKATLATQRELIKLRESGKTDTMLIGASMRNGRQVATLAGLDVYTMPPKVAIEYHAGPEESISSRVEDDPDVPLDQGITFDDFNGSTLWDVPDKLKQTVEELLQKDSEDLTAEAFQSHFKSAGIGDLLPDWSDDDLTTIAADGKIPVFDKWRERLASGQIGLDALMNLSAYYSFVADQAALDNRIKSLL